VAVELAAWETEVEDKDEEDGDIDWSDDGPNPEEQVAQQRAIVESFESQKKLQDDSRAREEDNVVWLRRAVDPTLQQVT
jgi:hypothetical protein